MEWGQGWPHPERKLKDAQKEDERVAVPEGSLSAHRGKVLAKGNIITEVGRGKLERKAHSQYSPR